MFDVKCMQMAIDLASAVTTEVPVGAVIVDPSGEVVGRGTNQIMNNKDPTAHAEIIAIKMATQKTEQCRLVGCFMYVTLEPCPMCMFAIKLARISRLYIGASTKPAPDNHFVEVYDNIMEKECSELLKGFFKRKR